ncbi:hypothetical protein Micbo1qcDRAFT_225223 [Microdochium bolleyi]|uniref:BTB domain-containing protein n=1 Tax=Microdochium bolleyi TaxID=196109 RepID=A0A136J2A9_9PEZI|nr:hypothetical protein Micbo1qcDRAFT_225223 [Microdochium bolleyi]
MTRASINGPLHHKSVSSPPTTRSRGFSVELGSEVRRGQPLQVFMDTVSSKPGVPFTFVVGPDAIEIEVEEHAFVPLSSFFRALMQGPMREARERRVVIDDIDSETFMCLRQFALNGVYAAPAGGMVNCKDGAGSSAPAASLGSWAGLGRLASPPDSDVTGVKAAKAFFQLSESYNASLLSNKTRTRTDVTTNISMHVKVYALAHRYMVEELEQLALHNLCSSLMALPFVAVRHELPSAIETLMTHECPAGNPAREVLATYMACMTDCGGVLPIWRRFPQFAVDVLIKVRNLVR